MQSSTARFTAGVGDIRCIRTWYVIFILLLCSENLNDEGFHSSTRGGFSPPCIHVVTASSLSQAPQHVNVHNSAAVGSAPPECERRNKPPLHSYSRNKLSTSELSLEEQRSPAGRNQESMESSASVIRLLVRVPFGSRRRSVSHDVQNPEEEKASQKPASNSIFLSVPAGRNSFAPSVSYAPMKQNDETSDFLRLSGYTYALTASETSFKSVPLLSLPENTGLRPHARDDALRTYLSDEIFPRDRLPSSISLSPPLALERASGVEMDLFSSAAEKEMHQNSTSTSVIAACTRGPNKHTPSSFLHISSASEAVPRWSSTAIPSACRYAGCKAGTFQGRDVSDKQSCFAFAHCSRCPLYPVERVEYCSKLKEESNYMLLMQSSLHLMPEPEVPFHYRPSGDAKAGVKSERLEAHESRAAEEQSEGAPSERGSEDWFVNDSGRDDEAEPSLLHVSNRVAFPVRTSQLRHMPASTGKPWRDTVKAALTEEAFKSSPAKESIATGKFTVSSLLEDGETLPNAEWETPDFAEGEPDHWTERQVQLGEWKNNEAHEEDEGERKSVSRTGQVPETPVAELLKFEQSRTFRVKQAEMRSHLGECAISTKGVIRLLLMFAFQPTRAKMSVQTARQRLGLSTTTAGVQPAEAPEREGQPWEEEGAESWTDEEGPALGDLPPSAYVEQHSSSDEPEGNQPLSSSVRRSPPSPPYSQGDEESIFRSSPSIHVESDRRSNFAKQSDSIPNKNCSDGIQSEPSSSSDAVFTRARGSSRLSQEKERASMLQIQTEFTQEGDAEDDEGEPAAKTSALGRFAGRVKGLFRSRKKMDEESEETAPRYEQEEEDEDAGESVAAKRAEVGGKARDSRIKGFLRKVFRRKTPEQKRELQEKKKATKVLVHAPKVHLEIAIASPAVRKCRKPLEWSGRLRLSTMLHVQYFVAVRKDEIQDQVPAFINNALRIVMRCESKQGCIINRDLQSCVLVSLQTQSLRCW